MNRKECESRIVPTARYITVLDFEVGRVFRYKLEKDLVEEGDGFCPYEEFINDKGHRLNNCEWMVHDNNEIITN